MMILAVANSININNQTKIRFVDIFEINITKKCIE
jgi:hypothetical protein